MTVVIFNGLVAGVQYSAERHRKVVNISVYTLRCFHLVNVSAPVIGDFMNACVFVCMLVVYLTSVCNGTVAHLPTV
jgi:hypothetical protein